ncbi:ABC transporter permease [Falsiporphyromonas endometrii]|uniref:ABC transporter permease n=1 Tax=Falsiporphyromonas endometrii TaxID=1387297 RepID=A0ABV9K6V3_9PORP
MLLFKNFISILRRNLVANILNLLGLVLAFAAVFVIFIQVDYTLNFNKEITDSDRIYEVFVDPGELGDGWIETFSRPFVERFASNCPNIQSLSMIESYNRLSNYAPNEDIQRKIEIKCVNGINNYLKIFSPKMICGDANCLDRVDMVVIPRSISQKLFGRVDVVGQKIKNTRSGYDLTIGGVCEDFQDNSTYSNCIFTSDDSNKGNVNNWNYQVFVKVDNAANVSKVAQQFETFIKEMFQSRGVEGLDQIKVKLLPLHSLVLPMRDIEAGKTYSLSTYLLICFSIIILIIAAINFVNFKQAEMPMRIRSLSTQKILGASKRRVNLMIISEGIFISLTAFVFFLIVINLLPSWGVQQLISGTIDLTHWRILILMVMIAVIIGLIAGGYPTIFVSKISPIMGMRGNLGMTPKGKLMRTVLISFQFAASVLLIVWVFIMQQQSLFIHNQDYGFDKDHIVYAPFTVEFGQHENALKEALLKINGVEAVALSQFVIGSSDVYMEWGQNDDKGRNVNLTVFPCDKDYLKVLGIKPIDGSDFESSDRNQMIVTKNTTLIYPFVQLGYHLRSFPVVGVVPNLTFHSLYSDDSKKALAFTIFGTKEDYSDWSWKDVINVRISKGVDQFAVIDKLNKVLNDFSIEDQSQFKFIDEAMNDNYAMDYLFKKQILVFALLSVLISIIGVFGVTMFESEYRRKEISIRKIMGSTVLDILLLFNRRYIRIITISFVISAPIGYFLGIKWLSSFAIKTSISPWLFIVAYVLILVVAVATISLQCLRRALQNPIKSIRTE